MLLYYYQSFFLKHKVGYVGIKGSSGDGAWDLFEPVMSVVLLLQQANQGHSFKQIILLQFALILLLEFRFDNMWII